MGNLIKYRLGPALNTGLDLLTFRSFQHKVMSNIMEGKQKTFKRTFVEVGKESVLLTSAQIFM